MHLQSKSVIVRCICDFFFFFFAFTGAGKKLLSWCNMRWQSHKPRIQQTLWQSGVWLCWLLQEACSWLNPRGWMQIGGIWSIPLKDFLMANWVGKWYVPEAAESRHCLKTQERGTNAEACKFMCVVYFHSRMEGESKRGRKITKQLQLPYSKYSCWSTLIKLDY